MGKTNQIQQQQYERFRKDLDMCKNVADVYKLFQTMPIRCDMRPISGRTFKLDKVLDDGYVGFNIKFSRWEDMDVYTVYKHGNQYVLTAAIKRGYKNDLTDIISNKIIDFDLRNSDNILMDK